MGSQQWVIRDPARREELLALLRASPQPRVTAWELARKMSISRSCMSALLRALKREGKVDTECDISMRPTPRSGAPMVAWLVTPQTKRLGKRLKPRPVGFTARACGAYVHPYAPTGTPIERAGHIQVIAVQGRAS